MYGKWRFVRSGVEKDKDLLPVPGIETHFLGCPVPLELIGWSLKKFV
jgi:hypothetical protein